MPFIRDAAGPFPPVPDNATKEGPCYNEPEEITNVRVLLRWAIGAAALYLTVLLGQQLGLKMAITDVAGAFIAVLVLTLGAGWCTVFLPRVGRPS